MLVLGAFSIRVGVMGTLQMLVDGLDGGFVITIFLKVVRLGLFNVFYSAINLLQVLVVPTKRFFVFFLLYLLLLLVHTLSLILAIKRFSRLLSSSVLKSILITSSLGKVVIQVLFLFFYDLYADSSRFRLGIEHMLIALNGIVSIMLIIGVSILLD